MRNRADYTPRGRLNSRSRRRRASSAVEFLFVNSKTDRRTDTFVYMHTYIIRDYDNVNITDAVLLVSYYFPSSFPQKSRSVVADHSQVRDTNTVARCTMSCTRV